MTASKNSNKRVYNDDGTLSYQHRREIVRKKGKSSFENWEISGSKDEKGGKRKFNLSKWVKNNTRRSLKRSANSSRLRQGNE